MEYLTGKELELVWEVEGYQLDIFWSTSMNSTGSGTALLKWGWTFPDLPMARHGMPEWRYSQVPRRAVLEYSLENETVTFAPIKLLRKKL